jgi:hypothetical protein
MRNILHYAAKRAASAATIAMTMLGGLTPGHAVENAVVATLVGSWSGSGYMRSRLRIDGARASADWEERPFNANGSAPGGVGDSSTSLGLSGGALQDRCRSGSVSHSTLLAFPPKASA